MLKIGFFTSKNMSEKWRTGTIRRLPYKHTCTLRPAHDSMPAHIFFWACKCVHPLEIIQALSLTI